jgi:DNA polymerase III subunit epsilon
MWNWLRNLFSRKAPRLQSIPGTHTDLHKNVAPGENWLDNLPTSVVAVDVETTGLHSRDRIVTLGAIHLPTAPLAEGLFEARCLHLVFDPGRKSHPEAAFVHGYDDWTLRHQQPFAEHADTIRHFIYSGDLILAHNVSFDLRFINDEMVRAGKAARFNRPIYCTMNGYRDRFGHGSAALGSVCAQIGLARAESRHGALEDAWMALMIYLWLHGCPYRAPFNLPAESRGPVNLLPCPPRPEGRLPRRKSKKVNC